MHVPIGLDLDRQRERKRDGVDVADRFSDGARPESYDRNAATVAAFDDRTQFIRLGGGAGQLVNVVFAPVIAGTLERPHVIWLRFRIGEFRAEVMRLFDSLIDRKVGCAGVLVLRGSE